MRLNRAVVGPVSAICKGFAVTNPVVTFGSEKRLLALLNGSRDRPLITVSNHVSVVDDPFLFGALLPWSILLNPQINRYGFGAREICFKNPCVLLIFSWFFDQGGVIPIVRGGGINQPGMDVALQLLNENKWFHIFSEGFVNQSFELKPFRWGVGRLIAESKTAPLILPFYHTGLQKAIPESRKIKFPTPGYTSYCQFGEVFDSGPLVTESLSMDRPRAYSFLTQQVFSKTDALRIQTLVKIKNLDSH